MYQAVDASEELTQGDVLDGCIFYTLDISTHPYDPETPPIRWSVRAVVLTQACDLAQAKATRVVVAPIHEATELVAKNILKASLIRDQVRRGQVFGWYFLPAAPAPINLGESIVDLRELHTVERRTLEYLVGAGKRVCRIQTP